MKEEEFRKLLEKSIKGTITKAESEILERFEKRMALNEVEPSFKDDLKKENLKKTIWNGINDKINNKRSGLKFWKRISVSASIVFCLSAGGYLFWKQLNTSPIELDDVITLELEDGTIKVLQEHDEANVVNENGNVIGKQNKNQLVYTGTSQALQKLVYNTLSVPYGKTFQLKLSDGTKVHLNAGSSLKYPVQFINGEERKVFVTGEIFLDVTKDENHPFIVNSDNLNVKVLGTQFNVNAYPEDDVAEVVLVEGSVSLYSNHTDSNELLKPGYKASFNRVSEEISKIKVPTGIYTSWMNGELVFRNMSFENILKKLERYYDVTIINNNKELSADKFNASFGSNPDIKEVLAELKTTYSLDYQIEEKTITIN